MESGFTVQRKRRWKLPVGILLLIVAIMVAPTVITKTSLLNRVVAWAAPELDGKLEFGAVRASWFSPIEIHQVRLRDLENQPMFAADAVSTERSLWGLITNRSDIGLIQIVNPEILLRVSEDSSNLEDLLTTFASDGPSSPSTSATPALNIQVDNGSVNIQDLVTNQSWQFSQLMVNCNVPANLDGPLTGAIFSQLVDQLNSPQQEGKLSGQFQFVQSQPGTIPSSVDSFLPPSIGSGQFQLETSGFPLNLVNVGLRRSGTPGVIVGYCDSKLDCNWGNNNSQAAASVVGTVQLNNAQLALPDYLGDDQVSLEKVNVVIDSRIENSLLTAKTLNLTTDHGRIRFAGTAPLSELTGNDIVEALLSPRSQNQYQLEGRIDLAGLLASLPHTLQVRDGTTINSGNLQFDVKSALSEGHRDLTGTLDARDLAATRDGQSFRWSQPVQVEFKGVANADGLAIEKATCNSDFFQAQAGGQIDQGKLQASADLNRLMSELGQFFDLQGNQLAGDMNATIQWQQTDATHVQCDAKMRLSNFQYVTPQNQAWTEPLLTIDGNATVGLVNYAVQDIQATTVTVTSAADTLTATLTQPVSDPMTASWPLNVTVVGDIQNWLTRARPWFKPESWTVAGNVEADVKGSFSPQLVNIEQAQATIRNLDFNHPSIHAQESVAQLQGTASWDGQTGQVTAPWFTLTGTTLALRGENCEVQTAGPAITANGQAAFRADIGKLYHWIQDPNQPPTARAIGVAEGRLQARTQGTAIGFSVNSTVRDFAYEQAAEPSQNFAIPQSSPWNVLWSEPVLSVTSNGQYDSAEDRVAFESINVSGESVQVEATGQLTALSSIPQADVNGKLTYDLPRIIGQLKLGPAIQLFGKQTHPFVIQGPLMAAAVSVSPRVASATPIPTRSPTVVASSAAAGANVVQPLVPPDLNARASFGWDGASIYGVALGPSQLSAQLSQGVVLSSPLDIKVGTSQVHLAPTMHLNADPMTLVLEQGPLAQSVEITPEMCGTWLKYVAPLLANAAVAKGTFSVDLAGAQIPVTDPMNASVGGRMTIHQATVQPGPLAAQLVSITDQVTQMIGKKKQNLDFLSADKSWMEIRENQIDFQMQQGRVYHRNLEVAVGKVRVATEGWVAVDQTMSMVASIPVLDEWVDGEPLLAGLKGQKLAIPIQGTFSDPKVDKQVLSQFSKDLVGGAAQQYLQGELQKGLQKLLKGR